MDKAIDLNKLRQLKAEVENQRQAYEHAFEQAEGLRELEESLSEIPEQKKAFEEQYPTLKLSPIYQAVKEQHAKTDKVAHKILESYARNILQFIQISGSPTKLFFLQYNYTNVEKKQTNKPYRKV